MINDIYVVVGHQKEQIMELLKIKLPLLNKLIKRDSRCTFKYED